MIKKYNTLSLLLGIPGLLLYVGGFAFAIINPGFLLVGLMGTALFIGGLAYYAKSKGRSPAWGLFGFLSLIGLVVLQCLKDVTLTAEEKMQQKKSPLLKIILGIILAVILFWVIGFILTAIFG